MGKREKKEKKNKKNKKNIEQMPDLSGFEQVGPVKDPNFREFNGLSESIDLTKESFSVERELDSPRIETLKEGIAPSAFERGATDYIIVGNRFCRTYYIEGFPSIVGIGYLTELYDSDFDVDISLSVNPRNQSSARKEMQDKLTIVKAQLEEEIEKGMNRNRDTYMQQIRDIEYQIAELASKEEQAYEAQFFFSLYAKSKDELERNSNLLIESLKNSDITAHIFALRQEQGWKTVMPYGLDYVQDKKRNFNTGAIVSSVPFYVPELYNKNGVFIGENTYSASPALLDLYRDGIQNSNINIFGASGSGKSTIVKALTMRSSLHGIRTAIIDPEGEYEDVTARLNGSNIRLTTGRDSVMMNIFDVEEDETIDVEGNRIKTLDLNAKYEDILGFVSVIYPKITPGQEANVLEVVEELYLRWGFEDGNPDSLYHNDDVIVTSDGMIQNSSYKKQVPKLGDLMDIMEVFILDGTFPNLRDVADALAPYRAGKARGLFDTHTPKQLERLADSTVINFNISALESSGLRNVAMYVLLSWIWEKFGKKNPKIKKRILVDEAWMMMNESVEGYQYTSSFLENMSRRIRKRNGALAIATQKIEDFASTTQGSAIISNAYTTFLLSHETRDKAVIQKEFDLDPGVVDNIIEAARGRVLIKQASQLYLIDLVLFPDEKKLLFTKS